MDDVPEGIEPADHQEDGGPQHDRARHDPGPQQVEREALARRLRRLGHPHDHREGDEDQRDRADRDERGFETEWPGQRGRDRRARGEAEDVGREQAAEVLTEVLRIGQDDDPADGGEGGPDADPGDDATGQDRRQRLTESHHQQPDHVAEHTDDDQPAGVAAVGEGGDEDLGDEGGEEAAPDHEADRRLADAVLVAEVTDDGEQHAVARGERGGQPVEEPH